MYSGPVNPYDMKNTMNPDQTAAHAEQSDIGPYCLQHKPARHTSRQPRKRSGATNS